MAIFRRRKDNEPDPTDTPANEAGEALAWLDDGDGDESADEVAPGQLRPSGLPRRTFKIPRPPRAASLEERLLGSLRDDAASQSGGRLGDVTDAELAEAEDADEPIEPPLLLRERPRRPEPGTDAGRAIRRAVTRALAEDLGDGGDVTAAATVLPRTAGVAVLVAREDGVVAGTELVQQTFEQVDSRVAVHLDVEDGDRVTAGQQLGRLEGPLRSILTGERVALNFLGHLSGIATATRRHVDAVDGTKAVIRDTRKTTPGLRLLEKMAVVAGGGVNHRLGLFDALLVKDNHNAAAGGVSAAARRALVRADERPVEVEVMSLSELDEAVEAGATEILLDNFAVEDIEIAVARVPAEVVLEASGGVTLDNVAQVAATGVHRIAVGALTHSSGWLDIALDVTTVEAASPSGPVVERADDEAEGNDESATDELADDAAADTAAVDVDEEDGIDLEDVGPAPEDETAGPPTHDGPTERLLEPEFEDEPELYEYRAAGSAAPASGQGLFEEHPANPDATPQSDVGVLGLDDPDPIPGLMDDLGLRGDTAVEELAAEDDDVPVPDEDLVDSFLEELDRDAAGGGESKADG